jgi:hypothetical protein
MFKALQSLVLAWDSMKEAAKERNHNTAEEIVVNMPWLLSIARYLISVNADVRYLLSLSPRQLIVVHSNSNSNSPCTSQHGSQPS